MADQIDFSGVQQAATSLAAALGRVTGQASGAGSAISSAGSQFSGSLKGVGQGMAQLRSEIDKGRVGYAQAGNSLRVLQSDFSVLSAEAQRSAAGQRIASEQTKMSGELLRRGVSEIAADLTKAGIGAALDYFKNQFFSAIKSIQDNVGGVQMAFNLQNRAIQDQITVLEALSQGSSVAAVALAAIPGSLGKFGAVTAGAIAAMSGYDAKLKKINAEGLAANQTELAKLIPTFKQVTDSGILMAGGLTDIRRFAGTAGMDVKEFGNLLTHNAKTLANFGGSAADGAKKFSYVSEAMTPFRKALNNLGISAQDQAQGAIDYMEMQQRSGKLQTMTAAEVAKGTASYLGNMKAMSALTGEDVKSQQARIKAASEQAGVQAALAEGGAEMEEKFKNLVGRFPGYEKEIGQLLTVGEVTDPLLATMLAGNAELDQALRTGVDNVKNNNVKAADAARENDERIKRDGAAMAANAREQQKTFGTINAATGAMGEQAALANRNFKFGQQGAEAQAKGVKAGVDQVADLATTTDVLTRETSNAATAYQNFTKRFTAETQASVEKFATKGSPVLGTKGLTDTIKEGQGRVATGMDLSTKLPPAISGNVGDRLGSIAEMLAKPIGVFSEAVEKFKNIKIRDMFKFAEGGVVDGPTMGLVGEAGPEAIIPLSGGRSVPVSFQGAEKMFAGALAAQKDKSGVGAAPSGDIAASVAAAVESAMSGPNGFGKSIGELKTQMAESSQQQTGVLQQQIEKLDALVTAMQDSADSNRRIANEMA
jgi:hypothetical protein